MNWLQARLSETESRAAVGVLVSAAGGWATGTMNTQTAITAAVGALVAFFVPSPK